MSWPNPDAAKLLELVRRYLREPSGYGHDDASGPWITFEPPLSAGEQATFDKLLRYVRSGVTISPEAWNAVAGDLDGLKAYHGLPNPTAAQTAQATKAIIRVLRALLRDE